MFHRIAFRIVGGLVLFVNSDVMALPVTLATDESALFNIDLTDEGSAPFTNVELQFNVTGPGGSELFSFDVFGELFGVDFVAAFSDLTIGSATSTIPDGDYAADGLFSVGFTASVGPVTITDLYATGDDSAGLPVRSDGAFVPMPAPLALLSIGLAGLYCGRRLQFKAA